MREIKFRVWFKLLKRMDYKSTTGGNVFLNDMFVNGENISVIYSQYTGVKDKNGVEIYEGDILKYTWAGEEKIDHIMYDAPMFTYSKVTRWSLHEDEVIGNIYENTELLEVIK